MGQVAGLDLGQERGRWRFVFVALADGALHRVDRIPADAVWRETLRLDLVGVARIACGPKDPQGGSLAESLLQEVTTVAADAGVVVDRADPEEAYARIRGTGRHDVPKDRELYPRSTLEGFQQRIEILHAAGLRPSRIYGGVGLLDPNTVLDATALAWWADHQTPDDA